MESRSLPTIIFSSTYVSPFSWHFLAKLMPKLKQLGYDFFYDQMPANASLQDILPLTENAPNSTQSEEMFQKLQQKALKILEQHNYNDLENYMWADLNENDIDLGAATMYFLSYWKGTKEGIDSAVKIAFINLFTNSPPISSLITKTQQIFFEAKKTAIGCINQFIPLMVTRLIDHKSCAREFYLALQNHQINYIPIDNNPHLKTMVTELIQMPNQPPIPMKSTREMWEQKEKEAKQNFMNIFSEKNRAETDKEMINTYLGSRASGPVMGRIGIHQTKLMQEEILKNYALEDAKNYFYFIDLYDEGSVIDKSIEEALSDVLELPLPREHIGVNDKNLDEMLNLVVARIQQKTASLQKASFCSHFDIGSPALFASPTTPQIQAGASVQLAKVSSHSGP